MSSELYVTQIYGFKLSMQVICKCKSEVYCTLPNAISKHIQMDWAIINQVQNIP